MTRITWTVGERVRSLDEHLSVGTITKIDHDAYLPISVRWDDGSLSAERGTMIVPLDTAPTMTRGGQA